MLSLPLDVLDKALNLLIEGIIGLGFETMDQDTPSDQLSQKAEALEFVQQVFISHIQTRMISIRRQMNELLPISKLPNELLQQIFLYTCRVVYRFPSYRAPTNLAAVSWRWRSVTITYPQLWSSLHSDLGAEVTRLMLQRSKSAPLDLYCSCQSEIKGDRFFDLLTPHSMRWRSLHFFIDNPSGLSLDFLAGQSLPLLKFLTLPQTERGQNSNLRNLNIIAPSIRELSAYVHPLPLRLDSDMLSMLTTLSFTASNNAIPFLPTDYYTLLTSAPYLQELFIRGHRNADSPDPDVAALIPINLPYLDNLYLEELRYKTIGFLLSSIVTPFDRDYAVDVSGSCGSLTTMFSFSPADDSLLADFHRTSRSILTSTWIGVSVEIDSGTVRDRTHLLELIVWESDSAVDDLFITMSALLSGIKMLEINGLKILLYGLSDNLHLLPRLETINVVSDHDDGEEYRDALEQTITVLASRSPPDQSSQLICPSLRHITLDTFPFNWDCLVKLVLARTLEGGKGLWNECRLELVLGGKAILDDPTLQLLNNFRTTRNFDLDYREYSI
ncbi:hypothetical protein FRC03_012008 [Tulasnella sp. 419]|nr:hypothetical protein FRC03_012008 [Tulasnella sp. 419]